MSNFLPFRRPAPQLDTTGNEWVVCLVERHGRRIAPEIVYRGSLFACQIDEFIRTFHHVTGTLYRIMPAREVRQQ